MSMSNIRIASWYHFAKIGYNDYTATRVDNPQGPGSANAVEIMVDGYWLFTPRGVYYCIGSFGKRTDGIIYIRFIPGAAYYYEYVEPPTHVIKALDELMGGIS